VETAQISQAGHGNRSADFSTPRGLQPPGNGRREVDRAAVEVRIDTAAGTIASFRVRDASMFDAGREVVVEGESYSVTRLVAHTHVIAGRSSVSWVAHVIGLPDA
jgi:hypothetical protein